MTSSDAKLQKIQTHFQALTETASSLNASSDELTRVVGILDEALKKLNVGLTVWVTFLTWAEEPPRYNYEQIGYCKVNNKWGIALHRVFGDEALGEEEKMVRGVLMTRLVRCVFRGWTNSRNSLRLSTPKQSRPLITSKRKPNLSVILPLRSR